MMGPGGEPVADARVVVLYRGLSTSVAAVTDANGKTQVKPLQGPIGLMAIKPGYGQGQAPFPSSWPATIQLKPFSPPLGGMRLPAAQPPGLAASQPAQPARK